MKSILTCISMVCLLAGSSVATAQSHEGSIGDSWNSAPKEKAPAGAKQTQPFLQGEKQYQAWEHRAQESQKTWTQKSQPIPMSRDYYTTNSRLIDSLSTLYCLSSNYLTTLRNRNEATRSGVPASPPQPKDFSYQQSVQEHTALPGRESPEALHKELLQLLDQCLYGRY